MREKIARYMEMAGKPIPAEQILRDVLNIFSPNAIAADKVLRGIVGADPHFRSNHGLWSLAGREALQPDDAAALHLEWDARRPECFRGAVHLPATGKSYEFGQIEVRKPAAVAPLREARLRAEGHLLLVWSRNELRSWNRLLRSRGLLAWGGEYVSVNRLADRVLARRRTPWHAEDLASHLGLTPPDPEKPAAVARFWATAFRSLLDLVPVEHRRSRADLESWIAEGSIKVDFSKFAFDRSLLAGIPESPGVYLMKSRAGEIIYVGKSHNLRRRVRSYFTPRALRDEKVTRIHSQLYSLEYLPCATEVEALLLEMRMIRDFRPAINLHAEVHEQPGRYGRSGNLLLLVPAGEKAEIYFIRAGTFADRQSARLGRTPPGRLKARLKTIYFATRRRKPPESETWETEIVARFLRTHKRRLNFFDVDEAGSYERTLNRLESYLKDPDRLARKVYYR